jgi:hypothetical protein
MNWLALLPLFELAANTTLTVLSASGVTPANSAVLASGVESAINPLISKLQSGAAVTTDVMAGYGAMIGVLNSLKQNTGLDADTLAKINTYLVAAQDATTGFLTASKGLDLSKLTPVEPVE